MKYQVLFSLKNIGKVFINVGCCSRDWRFKGFRKKKKNNNTTIKQKCTYQRTVLRGVVPNRAFFKYS